MKNPCVTESLMLEAYVFDHIYFFYISLVTVMRLSIVKLLIIFFFQNLV